ncbi:MAG: hypothetical protein Kow00128_19460 [Deltaproteobacteria bacterium]
MVEFLLVGPLLLLLVGSGIQLSFLWAGQGAVDTAAHFAAREFARSARTDPAAARRAALARAMAECRNRWGGGIARAAMTFLEISREGTGRPSGIGGTPGCGEACRVTLRHGVELAVPGINRFLFALAPVEKMRVGGRYYLVLRATRFVTVE